ncbi:Ribosomal protein L25 [Beggiatoa sp. PS]|nr:Ribosomal protein L25 [Beggiatoa sp. PS]
MEQFKIEAQLRTERGKGENRRLRKAGYVPAIIYGGDKEPISLTLSHNDLLRQLEHEAFYSRILTVNIDDQPEQAVLKDLHRHPYRPTILHLDFQRVSEAQKLYREVPLHFINESKSVGVKLGGGLVSHHLAEVEIRCFPKDLPEFIEVDLTEINLNDTVHLSDLVLSEGVEIVALISKDASRNLPVASVNLPRGAQTEEEDAEKEASASTEE